MELREQQLPYKEPTEGISGSQRSHSRSHVDGTQGTTAPIQGAKLRHLRVPALSFEEPCSLTQEATAPIQGANLRDFREPALSFKDSCSLTQAPSFEERTRRNLRKSSS